MTFDGGYRVFSGGHPVQVEHKQLVYMILVTIKPFTDLQNKWMQILRIILNLQYAIFRSFTDKII